MGVNQYHVNQLNYYITFWYFEVLPGGFEIEDVVCRLATIDTACEILRERVLRKRM